MSIIWFIVIFVAMASAVDFSLNHDKRFEDPIEIRDFFDPFIDIVSEYKNFTKTSANEMCDFGPGGAHVPKKVFNLNRMMNIRLYDVFHRIREIMGVVSFQEVTGGLLYENIYLLLTRMEQLYNDCTYLLSVRHETHEDYLRGVIDLMMNVIGPLRNVNIPNIWMSQVHAEILQSSNAKEPINFLNILQSHYHHNLRDCESFEDIQKIILALYLSLVSNEVTGFLVFVQSHWFHAMTTGEIEIDVLKSAMGSSLERIEDYFAGVNATMAEFAPKCKCQPMSTMSIMTNQYGLYREFYRIASTKEILFHTNGTRSICVHLATNDNAASILFDICFGTNVNTLHVIRKNGATISNVLHDANQFPPGQIHHFRVSWSNNVLSAEYFGNRPASSPFYTKYAVTNPTLLMKTAIDADLVKISHYTVTSPFVDFIQWNITNVQPTPTGPSDLVKRIKLCYCDKSAINITNLIHVDRPCGVMLNKVPLINGIIYQSKCYIEDRQNSRGYHLQFSVEDGCIPQNQLPN